MFDGYSAYEGSVLYYAVQVIVTILCELDLAKLFTEIKQSQATNHKLKLRKENLFSMLMFRLFDRDECVGEDMVYDVFLCCSGDDLLFCNNV